MSHSGNWGSRRLSIVPEVDCKGEGMAKNIVIEHFHLTVFAPRKLPEADYQAMHRTLSRGRFRVRLQRALQRVCRRFRTLSRAKVRVSW